jgi:hypothetical protein
VTGNAAWFDATTTGMLFADVAAPRASGVPPKLRALNSSLWSDTLRAAEPADTEVGAADALALSEPPPPPPPPPMPVPNPEPPIRFSVVVDVDVMAAIFVLLPTVSGTAEPPGIGRFEVVAATAPEVPRFT